MCPTYSACNPLFRFTPNVPRRVLTVPSTGEGNDGLDNADFNLIARVNDVLEGARTSYSVLDLLGQGTFGQVFRCQDLNTKEIVAVKVVKNKPAYHNQALLEIHVARLVSAYTKVSVAVSAEPVPCDVGLVQIMSCASYRGTSEVLYEGRTFVLAWPQAMYFQDVDTAFKLWRKIPPSHLESSAVQKALGLRERVGDAGRITAPWILS